MLPGKSRLPPENLSAIVPAEVPPRFVNLATPPETVAVVVPCSGPGPLASDAVTTVELSPSLDVAVLVFFVDDRLGRERLTGRRRRGRLGLDHQLAWRRRAHDGFGWRYHAQAACGEPKRDGFSDVVCQIVERRDSVLQGHARRALQAHRYRWRAKLRAP